jgi:hypothetical protein
MAHRPTVEQVRGRLQPPRASLRYQAASSRARVAQLRLQPWSGAAFQRARRQLASPWPHACCAGRRRASGSRSGSTTPRPAPAWSRSCHRRTSTASCDSMACRARQFWQASRRARLVHLPPALSYAPSRATTRALRRHLRGLGCQAHLHGIEDLRALCAVRLHPDCAYYTQTW